MARWFFRLSGGQGLLVPAERLVDQSLLARQVAVVVATRGCRHDRPASIDERLAWRERSPKRVANEEPRALVLRLFLRPDHFTQSRVARKFGRHLRVRIRAQLLEDPARRFR